MNRVYVIIAIFVLLGIGGISNYLNNKSTRPTYNLNQSEDIGKIDEQHSLSIETLKNMVVSKDVKAGVIWAGVVASYIEKYGSPESNPTFWNSISANSYLFDISGPIQLHHGSLDASVPIVFSEKLEQQLKQAGKTVEAFYYPDDDHNLASNLDLALQRSVEFFDRILKNP